jgi:hypothetical protein
LQKHKYRKNKYFLIEIIEEQEIIDNDMVKTPSKHKKDRQGKETKVTWSILDYLLKEIRHLAIDDDVTPNLLVEQALKDYLQKRGRLSSTTKK